MTRIVAPRIAGSGMVSEMEDREQDQLSYDIRMNIEGFMWELVEKGGFTIDE